jgi:hypothetical protein
MVSELNLSEAASETVAAEGTTSRTAGSPKDPKKPGGGTDSGTVGSGTVPMTAGEGPKPCRTGSKGGRGGKPQPRQPQRTWLSACWISAEAGFAVPEGSAGLLVSGPQGGPWGDRLGGNFGVGAGGKGVEGRGCRGGDSRCEMLQFKCE